MTKGFVFSCVDFRLHGLADKAAALMGVDTAYNMRLGGPDGILATTAYPAQKAAVVAEFERFKGAYSAGAVVGHTTCSGNNVDDAVHRLQTMAAAKYLRDTLSISSEVPLYAYLAVRGATDEDWSFENLGTF